MRLYGFVAFTLSLAPAAATNATWAPCSLVANPNEAMGDLNIAECTVYTAPLCHPGICETPDSANATIDVFVKRLPAKVKSKTNRNVWLLQGGPNYSRAACKYDASVEIYRVEEELTFDVVCVPLNGLPVDLLRLNVYNELGGKVNVYSMDHRGTGQSTLLKCKNAQTPEPASYNKGGLHASQVPACAMELEQKFGDLASFSTTSAAMDVVNFISDYGSDFSTTIYGMDYGSLWVERIMHLDPPEVVGYVFDTPTTTSGVALGGFANVTSLDAAFGEVADTFLDLCAEDSECRARFKKKGLKATVRYLMNKLDTNPKSKCAKLVRSIKIGEESDPPSFALRYMLATLLREVNIRTLIAPIVYRLLLKTAPPV